MTHKPTTSVRDGKISGLECVGSAINAGHPPPDLKDLIIQINVPGQKTDEFVTYFQSFAHSCDGIGVQGRFLPANWEKIHTGLTRGIVFYSLPSLELAKQTVDNWSTNADWFAYEMILRENTPAAESSDPEEASRAAMEFAHSHNLTYMATPGRPITKRSAADIAQYADAYGLQAYGESRESPDTFIQFVKDTSQKIRTVKPDILLFIAFSTDQATDDVKTT